MKKMSVILAGLLLAGSVQLAVAADNPSDYDQMGGKPVITKIVDGMVNRVTTDPRISSFFANTNIPRLKMLLVEQFCVETGGPCTYTGRSMSDAHKGMNVDSAQFNALVEDLQLSLAENNIPIGLGNRLLAKLAPMKKDVDHK